MVRTALYTRVSTSDQNCEAQLRELRLYAEQRGWEIVDEFSDQISGAKGRRPGLNRLLDTARQHRFDSVLCWKLDRFGRSLPDCLSAIQELQSSGVRFIATSQGIDTDENNPASRFLLHILAAAAEFERELIRERAHAGLSRYREDYDKGRVGKEVQSRSGKNLPVGRPKRVFDRQAVLELRRQGLSWREIAKRLGVGKGTVVRAAQEARIA